MSTILDPTDERVSVERQLAVRPSEITGNVALLDISKPRGNVLLDRLAGQLTSALPGITINRYSKPTFAKVAPEDLRRKIQQNNGFVIEALAD